MTNFCPKCGNQIEANQKFCEKCGAEISSLKSNVKSRDSKTIQKSNNNFKEKKLNGKTKAIILAILLVVFVAIIALVIFAFNNNADNDKNQ
ncbi:MAG: zinc-ribbon domain-containing protein, partial [Coriobacteriales bacterium]|nr:zinc-ribbon domain-containing protein [Coriobacteriales bacterium]